MIGVHIIGNVGQHLDVIRKWQPRVVLLLDPEPGAAGAIKAASPKSKIIGRVWRADGEIADKIRQNPQAAAEWGASIIQSHAAGNSQVDWWQFTNEVQQTSTEEIQRLNTFSIAYVNALKARGLKAAIGAFSVGNPKTPHEDSSQWAAFYPAMRHAKANGGVLLLHAYGAPRIFDSDRNWYLQRYERLVLPHLPADLRDMPYIYGEYGCDMGIISQGNKEGWLTGYHGNWHTYGADLLEAAHFLAQYPQCYGAAIFTLGTFGEWWNFDITGDCAHHLATLPWPGVQKSVAVASKEPFVNRRVLSSAEAALTIDRSWQSRNFDNRPAGMAIDTVVLHHTGGNAQSSLHHLTNPLSEVSAHYLITKTGHIYQLVDESKRAWHAGESSFMNRPDVNDFTIGIELENLGTGNDPYPIEQQNALVWLLSDIKGRRGIQREMVTTHAVVALPFGRKNDPKGLDVVGILNQVYDTEMNGHFAAHLTWSKIVWQAEDAMRSEEREGRVENAAWIEANWVRPAIDERDNLLA